MANALSKETDYVDVVAEDKFTVDVMREMVNVRMQAISAVRGLRDEYAMAVIRMMISLHRSEQARHPRYHGESGTHKLRERAWQTITYLLAIGAIGEETMIRELFDECLHLINADEQNSVLMLQQVALVLCLRKHDEITGEKVLWPLLHNIIDDDLHQEKKGSGTFTRILINFIISITVRNPKIASFELTN